jgi:TetR/AcrR family transcriptional regulator, mexCD-oprJ operon repressor
MTTEPTGRNLRADAQRNRAAIIDAAVTCLAVNPRASMAEIAQGAGVGRVTLYGHFSSRRDLVEAIVEATMREADAQLAPLDLDGYPRAALDLLITSSWRMIDRFHGVVGAAEHELGVDRIRDHHDQAMFRVRRLIEGGQADGSFRTDQSAGWIAACFFAVLHGASAEIRAGRLRETEAGPVLTSTIQSLVSTPPPATPAP